MRFFYTVIPNLAISLDLALLVTLYLDLRNPMMGFLMGPPFLVLTISACVTSIISAVLLYTGCRK